MAEIAIGIVGTGFIGTHFALAVDASKRHRVSKVLTRRPPSSLTGFPEDVTTGSVADLIDQCDVVVECSGDPVWATEVAAAAIDVGRPVVTMNTEFHITTGSAFARRGLVTEAAGDQPGALAELYEEAVAMGFHPVVFGNMKGFLNRNPAKDEMEYWAQKQGLSLPMVTSFTDGTKVQAEQILVANHFGATIAEQGMLGPEVSDLAEGVEILASSMEERGKPISDFIVSPALPHGVFIVATHTEQQRAALEYLKLGPGPYYTIIRNNIFVHLEILKTVDRIMTGGGILLDNSPRPTLSLGAVAKRDLPAGLVLEFGIGSFDVRGEALAISQSPSHAPIGLLGGAQLKRPIEREALLTLDDVEIPDSLAKNLWNDIVATTVPGSIVSCDLDTHERH